MPKLAPGNYEGISAKQRAESYAIAAAPLRSRADKLARDMAKERREAQQVITELRRERAYGCR